MNAGEYYQKNKAIDLSSRMLLNKNTFLSSKIIEHWKSLLEITHWTIVCESISEMQVVDALNGNTPGHEFVGIAIDFEKSKGIIFHTRPLHEDDIIHELLHVRFPSWSEEDVNFWTNVLIKRTRVETTLNKDTLLAS